MTSRCRVRAAQPLSARLIKARLLLHLLTVHSRKGQQTGYTMVAGILVILALLVGTLGVVAIVNGSNLGTFGSGEARDSQQVAEAGADQIITTFNQPENRQLLVAGSTPPSQWSTTNEALRSPCVSNTDKRPGANNDGYPTAQAVSFADGKFRNLENIAQTSTGTRQFLLKSIRYSAGSPGDTNRRSIYVGYKADGSALTQGGTIPSGTSFNSLINLDPGSGSTTAPGGNTGFIAVEVEGRLYRADGTYSTTTITREYEVLPKCCGGSFGTQGSGGSPLGVPFGSAGSTGALGADSRFCGIEFGLITGINNGRFWSQQVDRRYTRVSTTGKVVNVSAIIGIIAKPTYKWDRTTSQTDGVVVNTTAGPQTITQQVGCRTIPSPCNVNTDTNPSSGAAIPGSYSYMTSTGFAAGVCGPNVPLFTGNPNNYSPANKSFGDKASFDGRSASCVPIFPLYLSTGLPSVASKYFLPLGWTPNGNPASVAASSVTSDAPGAYPQITFISSVDTATSTAQNGVWIRANRATSVRQATAGAGGGQRRSAQLPICPSSSIAIRSICLAMPANPSPMAPTRFTPGP